MKNGNGEEVNYTDLKQIQYGIIWSWRKGGINI